MFWTGDRKVLIAWDMGCGPTWALDPEGDPIEEKYLGPCEVWRASGDNPGVCLGVTNAEACLDSNVANCTTVVYWVMERMKSGGLRQVGPRLDVALPQAASYPDQTPPSQPNELRAKRRSGGNELSWLPSCDPESGVLAYFVYSANETQPDAVLWAPPMVTVDGVLQIAEDYDGDIEEVAPAGDDGARFKWLDRTPNRKKPYYMRAIDGALNLSAATGRVDPFTHLPAPEVWPAGTVPESYVGQVKERWAGLGEVSEHLVQTADLSPISKDCPFQPVVPDEEAARELRGNLIRNPRLHFSTVDWALGQGASLARVTSVPWGPLPDGADACGCWHAVGSPYFNTLDTGLDVVLPNEWYDWTFTFGGQRDDEQAGSVKIEALVIYFDAVGNFISSKEMMIATWWPTGQWNTFANFSWLDAPQGTESGLLRLYFGITAPGYIYFTKMRLGANRGTVYRQYRDGDSADWYWTGTPHDSDSDGEV